MPENLTTQSKIKNHFILSAPLACAFVLNGINDQINTFILSKSGPTTLAASGLSALLYNPTVTIGNAGLTALPMLISKYYGEGNQNELIATLVKQGWILGVLLSIPQGIILACSKPILSLLQQPENLVGTSSNYFYLNIIGLPAVNILLANKGFAYGTAKTLPIIALNAFNLISGSLLMWGLVLGGAGIPELGIDGYAYATIIQAWLNACFLGAYLILQSTNNNYKFFNFKTKNFNDLAKRLITIGSSITLKTAILFTSTVFKQALIGTFGENSINAYQVVNSYNGYISYITDATNLAAYTLMGEAIGQKDYVSLLQFFKLGLGTSIGTSILFAIPSFAIPRQITSLFLTVNDAEEQYIIDQIFYISAIQAILDAVNQTLSGALSWTESAVLPVLLPFANFLLITLPLTLSLFYKTEMGLLGVATGFLVGSFTQTVALSAAWHYKLLEIRRELANSPTPEEDAEEALTTTISGNGKDFSDEIDTSKNLEINTDTAIKTKHFNTHYLTTFPTKLPAMNTRNALNNDQLQQQLRPS